MPFLFARNARRNKRDAKSIVEQILHDIQPVASAKGKKRRQARFRGVVVVCRKRKKTGERMSD